MKNLLPISIILLLLSCKQHQKGVPTNETGKIKELSSDQNMLRCSPKTSDKNWYTSNIKAPKFNGLEGINFFISTKKDEAQEYFNQGMMLAYGFNHAEAARSFFEGTRIDPESAMCFWGYAYVLGPNYNGGMVEDNFERAYNAAQKALSLSGSCTEKEKELINALSFRYSKSPPKDRKPLDIAYSSAMKKVYDQFPNDPDIGALYAESLLNLHPWDLYETKTRNPKKWTIELLSILEHLIKINPTHPGAHHFYIHAVEASMNPEKGLESAKLLTTMVPGSGHLLHMPSHIYINTGDYHLGTLANLEAVKMDSLYTTTCHAQGVYPLSYYPHNYHFLSATATLEGNSKLAWMAAKKVQENTAMDIMTQPGWGTLQHYYTIPYYVSVKFAMWDNILSIPIPDINLIYPRAVLNYARGMAFLGKKDVKNASAELSQLLESSKNPVLKSLTIWDINTTYDLIQIAIKILSAEILQQNKKYQEAISLLYEAVALESNLNYNEPPDWFFSVRHHLGAVLIKAGKYAEAEKTYLEDLKAFRENGWALIGLYNSLLQQNKIVESEKVKTRFDNAWKFADIKITSSSSL